MPEPSTQATQRRKLPIAIQNLREIREDGYYYVDKSGIAMDLIDNGKYYFLSRPRRFGKSLFLDTLKELFEGNQKLFTGLAAEKRWDWDVKHPVIWISFSDGVLQSRAELDVQILDLLRINRLRLQLPIPEGLPEEHISANFREIGRAHV